MDKLKEFYRNHLKRRLTSGAALILVLAVCSASLLTTYFKRDDAISPLLIAGAVIVPFQEGINELAGALFRNNRERLSLAEASERIDELESELTDREMKISQLEQLSQENRELRKLLNAADTVEEYGYMEATVIGNDGVGVFRRFLIDKGTRDGILVDMNVVNGDGLVGLVTSVGLNYAVVTTIIEDDVNVSAMTKNGHENCIVTGDVTVSGPAVLKLENALVSVDLVNDSTLVTSNISDKYLPGLLIGYADEIETNDGDLTQSGIVRTAADFTRLKEVLVITTLKEKKEEAE